MKADLSGPNQVKAGVIYTLAAYTLWGLAPLFWKQLNTTPALELLAHRTSWGVLMLAVVLSFRKQWGPLFTAFRSKTVLLTTLGSASLLAVNWFTFVYAILTERVLETSLGYFINPLINILLGYVFLKERLRFVQMLAVFLAGFGVLFLTLMTGNPPWLSLILAFSFGFYGLLRKIAAVDALPGLTMETFFLALPAVVLLGKLELGGGSSFTQGGLVLRLMLVGTGLITVGPLLLFGQGVRRLSLTTTGFLQYIAPSISFLLGVFVFHEAFDLPRLVAFVSIWLGLMLYSAEGLWRVRRRSKQAAPTG